MKSSFLSDNLKWLILSISLFGLFPFYNQKTKRFKTYKLHYIPLLIYNLCVLIFTVHQVIKYTHGHSVFETGLTLMMTSSSSITNLVMIITSSYLKVEEISTLFRTFNQIDKLFTTHRIEVKNLKFVCAKTLILSGCLCILIGLDISSWFFTAEESYSILLLSDNINNFLMLLVFLLQFFILKAIHLRYCMFNQHLQNGVSRFNVSDVTHNLKDIILIHNYLSDLVNLFNQIFGWNMLFELFYGLYLILYTICLLLLHSEEDILIYNIFWIVYAIVSVF